MSWWTNFRDAALTGAGLKKGRTAAKTLAGVARPTFQSTVGTAQPKPLPVNRKPFNGGFSPSDFLRNNKWFGFAAIAVGGLILYKAKMMK